MQVHTHLHSTQLEKSQHTLTLQAISIWMKMPLKEIYTTFSSYNKQFQGEREKEREDEYLR